ncbi:hypothetical protein LMG18102_01305 [Ralstonia mannitolilytica]|uniref:Wzz/FepE/Etk N-terminal domain-containing protein n=1 Tax=Ralstonia mannitolilytica TaxID=105219 RepID=UPI0028F67FC8|nr:Wzz/FepE/Etk N-terminal domain-containing protein [Ralstonia mannitolilytica]CAJ0690569.1 hypothetical protein LMG18102_01305 [Ralstonia mannitolilytica]
MTVTPLEEQPSTANVTRVLRESVRWVLLAGVIGAVAGVAASIVIPPRWTAKLTVQIGQVAMANTNGAPVKLPLENQLTAAERVNQPNFRLDVIKALGLPHPDTGSKKADLAFDSLRASAERSPDLITLQASSYSKEEALEIVDMAFKGFSATHQKLFEQSTETAHQELARAQNNLSAAEAAYRNAANALKSGYLGNGATAAGARDVLVSNTVALLRAQVSDLHQQVNAYRNALSPVQSYPTRAMAPAYVPERPSTPSRTVWVLGGVVIGLLVGAALALLWDTLKSL